MQGLGTPLSPRRAFAALLLVGLVTGCSSPRRVEPMPAIVVAPSNTVSLEAPQQSTPMRVFEDRNTEWRRVGPMPYEEEYTTWSAEGLYVGFMGVLAGPGKDFDGSMALASPTDVTTPDIVFIPDLDSGEGFGAYVSYRWRHWELMFVYEETEHDGDFPTTAVSHDTTITNFDLNLRRYWGEEYAFQPFLLIGLGWSEADIENGSTDQATMTVVADGGLEDGINLNLGGGLAFYPLPWVSVFGQAMWRFTEYKSTDGLAGKLDNGPTIEADGWNVSVGASIRLLRGRPR